LFLYLGYMALDAAIEDRRTASRAAAILALVGVVDLPIIHYSVEWWNTLHQGPTVTKLGAPSIHPSMLAPPPPHGPRLHGLLPLPHAGARAL